MTPIQFVGQGKQKRHPSPLLAVGLENLVEGFNPQQFGVHRNARTTAKTVRNVLPEAFAPFQEAADELADAKDVVTQLIQEVGSAPSKEDLIVEEKLGNIPDAEAAYADVQKLINDLESARADVRVAQKFAVALDQDGSEAMNALNSAISNHVSSKSATVQAAVQTAIDHLDTLTQSMEALDTHTTLQATAEDGPRIGAYTKHKELREVRKSLVELRTRVGGAE